MTREGNFKVVQEGVRRRFLADYYHSLIGMRWRTFLALFLASYLIINLVFSAFYWLCGPGALDGVGHENGTDAFLKCFFFSVQTFATIGYGKISPISLGANLLATLEAVIGMLSVALATGLVYARFSKPTAKVLFSDQAIILPIDGVPSLMFRIANQRLNQIVDARVSVTLVITETTKEGMEFRNLYDLPLERHHSSAFVMTWTVVHPIDEKSPLHGKSLDELRDCAALIMVSFIGIDDTVAQTVHARFTYTPDEIALDRNFKDMLISREDGKLGIDLSALSVLE